MTLVDILPQVFPYISPTEIARLAFLRWLVQSGRLTGDTSR